MSHAEELGTRITELASQIYAAEHRLLALIREFDEHQYWAEPGPRFLRPLAQSQMRHRHERRSREGAGGPCARPACPRSANASPGVELSYSKVRAITRIADASNEDDLLMIAEHGTAHHVEKLVSKCRKVSGCRKPKTPRRLYRNRELTHYYDHDGCLVIKARLPAEQGALVIKALEMAMDQDFRGKEEPEMQVGHRARLTLPR